MPHARFRLPALLAALLIPGLLTSPAQAAAASHLDAAAAPAVRTTELTLITGDRVSYARGADGSEDVATTPAPRTTGKTPYFETFRDATGYYVIPSDAQPLIRAGSVDRELFDVRELAAADELTAGRVPVIASYAGSPAGLKTRAESLPGATVRTTLPTIGAAALQVSDKVPDRQAFWRAATKPGAVKKLWLDAPYKATLSESVPHIGAPAVWATGHDGAGVPVAVLDTGVDLTHPDLAGKVAEARNFTSDPSAADGNGHGTHVASTIAGSGAASGGSRKGVAPGATLLAGKVLNNSGSGAESWILAGIEWAVQSGARVINMSFGGAVTDGTDLLSQTLNDYTARTGVLFVVAAGNSGPTDGTVSSPGAADSALTVGAVDRSDELAWFSSRGPRRGDGAVKPEITAPGWEIVAARAAGTNIGLPDGQYYTALSGTSMASPHVAGAAALLAQAHPDWRAGELKSALVGSADPVDGHVFTRGAGRVDVARAYTQQVSAQPATIGFGAFAWPQQGKPPVDRVVTYRNDGPVPVTLDLTAEVRTTAGQEAPGAIQLSSNTVTVPAGGTADVTVTLDPAAGPTGNLGGELVATGDGSTVRTPIGYFKSIPTHHLTVRLTGSKGQPASGSFSAVRADVSQHPANPFDQTVFEVYSEGGVVNVDLPEGVYDLGGYISEGGLTTNRTTFASESELDLRTADQELVLDARRGVPLRPETDKRTDPFSMTVGMVWKIGDHFAYLRSFSWAHNPDARMYGIPSSRRPSTPGRYTFETHWSFAPPLMELRSRGVTAWPAYGANPMAEPKLSGSYRTTLVGVGDGGTAGFAGRDVAGKLVLVTLTPPATNPYNYLFTQVATAVQNATAAGAEAVLFHVAVPGAVLLQPPVPFGTTVPVLSLRYDEGARLVSALAKGPAEALVDAQTSPASSYQLHYDSPSGIPSQASALVERDRLAKVPMRLHGDGPAQLNSLAFFAHTELPTNGIVTTGVTGPAEHTAYVGPVSDRLSWRRVVFQWQPTGELIQTMESLGRYDRAGRQDAEEWFGGPVTPETDRSAPPGEFPQLCGYCREGDLFMPIGYEADDAGHATLASPWLHQVRMFSGDTELELQPLSEDYFGIGYYVLPAQAASYRLEDTFDDPRGDGRRTRTTWWFRSAGRTPPGSVPDGSSCVMSRNDPDASCRHEPLIQLRYTLDADLHNTVPGGRTQRIELQAALPEQGRVTGATLQVSYDDGTHWESVRLRARDDGRLTGELRIPQQGTLSLRATAHDSAGNQVSQEVMRAYRVR